MRRRGCASTTLIGFARPRYQPVSVSCTGEPPGQVQAVLLLYAVEVEGRESALWTLRDGRVARYAWFHEPAEALEVAGLEE